MARLRPVAFGQIGRARILHLERIDGWTLCDRSTETARDVKRPELYDLCPRCRRRI